MRFFLTLGTLAVVVPALGGMLVMTPADEKKEEALLYDWVHTLPEPYATEMAELYQEMARRETLEAKIYKAIDSVEAVLSHNESDIKTWAPNEYELNLTYAYDKVAFSEYLMKLRDEIKQDTIKKIESENHRK